jgi:hypothetical protein
MALGPQALFLLNVLSAVVALLTSYYAYRFDRLADSPLLRGIAVGFMLLGLGLFMEAGTSLLIGQILVEIVVSRLLAVVATFAYLTTQMVAYIIISAGYGYLAFGRSKREVAGIVMATAGARAVDLAGLYWYALVSYFVVLVLLAFIVFQGLLIHSNTRSRFSLLVLLTFVLLLLAHLVLLVSVVDLSGILFLLGTAIQFAGFAALLTFLFRSRTVGPA